MKSWQEVKKARSAGLLKGVSWSGSIDTAVTVRYSFLTERLDGLMPRNVLQLNKFSKENLKPMSIYMQDMFIRALHQWQGIARINFVRDDSNPNLLIMLPEMKIPAQGITIPLYKIPII